MLTGSIFLTGGTGTLGQALVARAERENWPCTFTIYSRDEMKHIQMRKRFPSCSYILGDVSNYDLLEYAMAGHSLVIHAAALKHIPAGELNVMTVLSTNLLGSYHVAKAAMRLNIPRVIGISTDKACYPINTYGASKMLMERIFEEVHEYGLSNFYLVRYGNVLGSSGSVLPVWNKMAAENGKIIITDRSMTRFWTTTEAAIDLLLVSLSYDPGVITVPILKSCSMGEMADWLFPEEQKVIKGLRPGEKMHEDLISEEESSFSERFEAYGRSYYRLYPVSGEPISTHRFSFTSENAERLTKEELISML